MRGHMATKQMLLPLFPVFGKSSHQRRRVCIRFSQKLKGRHISLTDISDSLSRNNQGLAVQPHPDFFVCPPPVGIILILSITDIVIRQCRDKILQHCRHVFGERNPLHRNILLYLFRLHICIRSIPAKQLKKRNAKRIIIRTFIEDVLKSLRCRILRRHPRARHKDRVISVHNRTYSKIYDRNGPAIRIQHDIGRLQILVNNACIMKRL